MQKSRLDMLQEMAARDPKNTFARYGLAMELARVGRLDEAVRGFEELVAAVPDYVPGYFQGGRVLERLARLDEARELYRKGIAAAERTGNSHAREEIEAALALLS